jgi:hypothetical protein
MNKKAKPKFDKGPYHQVQKEKEEEFTYPYGMFVYAIRSPIDTLPKN